MKQPGWLEGIGRQDVPNLAQSGSGDCPTNGSSVLDRKMRAKRLIIQTILVHYEYFADLFIEETLIAELKACRALVNEHTAQILGYLRSSQREHGLLMNFGSYKFQIRK